MRKFMIEVNCSSFLTNKEIVQELRDGLHCIIGQQDPTDEYYQELEKTTLTIRRHYDRTKNAGSL